MFVRVNTVTGAQDIDGGVAHLRDKVVPELAGQKGFRGMTVTGNRSTGDFGILSLWDTREDRDASESSVSKLRKDAMAIVGGEIKVQLMEQVVAEVAGPENLEGRPLVITRVKMEPAKVDEHVEFFRSVVLPDMKATPGFLAVRNMIDRGSGEGIVGTIWADEEAVRGNVARAPERRARARERGVELSDPTYRTVLLYHIV